jgi:hypothetical protein
LEKQMSEVVEAHSRPAADGRAGVAGRPAVAGRVAGGWWREAIGPLLLAVAFAYLTVWSWGRWPDPVVDFGRELYVPWQISQGRLLEVDLVTCYGPFSHLFNGACFRLFGASLQTLVAVNLVLLAGITAVLYAVVRQLSTRLAAGLCGLLFLVGFGFAHLMFMGNFNFVTPYSHEATHGFAFGVAGLFCFLRLAATNRLRWVAGLGGCTGLAFLTKPEMFIPIAGAAGVGMGLWLWGRRFEGTKLRSVTTFVAAAAAPVALAAGYLWVRLPLYLALKATFGAWALVGNSRLTSNPFYLNSMGLDYPALALRATAWVAAWAGMLLGPPLVIACLMRDGGRRPRVAGAVVGGALLILMVALDRWMAWAFAGCLMLTGLAVLGPWQAALLARHWADARQRAWRMGRVVVLLFAGLMLLKMILNNRFQQYGFVLGVMGTLVLVVALVDWIPAGLEARGRRGWVFRAAAATFVAVLTVGLMGISGNCMKAKKAVVGFGPDVFVADERGPAMQDMAAYVAGTTEPGQTLTVLPEGAMLNFLTRRRSAVPFIAYTPPDEAMFGEDRMFAALQAGRPDYVAVLSRWTDNFGPARFGIDYDTRISAWLRDHYSAVHLSGGMPFAGSEFGILLLRRNDLSPVAAAASARPGVVR